MQLINQKQMTLIEENYFDLHRPLED